MDSEMISLLKENMSRMPYYEFMEWKTNVFDRLPRADGMILTLHQALDAIENGETDWEGLTDRVGRDDLPYIFESVETYLPADTFIQALTDSWTGPDAPEACLPQEEWIDFFRKAGFTRDGKPVDPPTEPVLLVRGGRYPDRMSWTATPSVAESFAKRSGGRLWATEAPPEAILAIINHQREGEDEHVLDPKMVNWVEVDAEALN